MTDDFRALVGRLRAERGMSLEDLAFEARAHAPGGAVSLSLIQKRLAPGSDARPSRELLEAIAAALDVDPNEFAEYRLARAREDLDERVVGLEEALENYDRIITALRQRGTLKATSSGRQAQDRRKRPPTPGEESSAQGGG